MNTWQSKRDLQIVEHVMAGASVDQVARHYRLSQMRIRQIVRQALPDGPYPWPSQKKVYTKELAQQCFARWEAGETYAHIAKDVGVSSGTVNGWIGHLRYQRAKAAADAAWSQPLSERERKHVSDLLIDALVHRTWEPVQDALDLLAQDPRTAFRDAEKRVKASRVAS